MSTVSEPMYEWKDLPWRKIERKVFKLQKRIYQAERRGDVKAVHRLQRLITKSWSAKCLAVRRVTQDNQEKRTAGVDGVKSLTPTARTDQALETERKASTSSMDVDTQTRHRRKTPVGDRDYARPGFANPGEVRLGTRKGSQVRTE